jgi:site-specific recombinase XerD
MSGVCDEFAKVFTSRHRKPLTRFGIYKIVKRHTSGLRSHPSDKKCRGVSPHVFRHSLLEQVVDVNVIRAWLGHVSLDTTNRYAKLP